MVKEIIIKGLDETSGKDMTDMYNKGFDATIHNKPLDAIKCVVFTKGM